MMSHNRHRFLSKPEFNNRLPCHRKPTPQHRHCLEACHHTSPPRLSATTSQRFQHRKSLSVIPKIDQTLQRSLKSQQTSYSTMSSLCAGAEPMKLENSADAQRQHKDMYMYKQSTLYPILISFCRMHNRQDRQLLEQPHATVHDTAHGTGFNAISLTAREQTHYTTQRPDLECP